MDRDEIKMLAVHAVKLQNKSVMDMALQEIIKICDRPIEASDALPRKITTKEMKDGK